MDIGTHSQRRDRLRRFLAERLFLRFHMFLILMGTFLSGLLVSKILLIFHVDSMLIRYPLAVIFSYLAFFGFIKLWLLYLASSERSRHFVKNVTERTGDLSDIPDIPLPSGLSSVDTPISIQPVSGGGGHFAGGGASGIFDNSSDLIHQTTSEALSIPVESSADGVADGVGGAAGEAASSIFEDAGIILIILGILLALILGAGAYLIYEAPAILSEAAFEFILATSLVRGMKRMDNPDWMGSILRTTIVPFIFVFVMALIVAAIAHSSYPQAKKLSEVISHLLSR